MASIAASAASVYSSPRAGNNINYVDSVKKKYLSFLKQLKDKKEKLRSNYRAGCILIVSGELHQLGIWLLLFKLEVMTGC